MIFEPKLRVYIDVSNPSRSISLAQAHTIIRQLIAGLRAWGIYYCMLVLATIGLDGIYTGTNPSYTSHELAHHFRTAEVRFVLSEPGIMGPVLEAANVVGISDSNVRVFNTLPTQTDSWIEFDDEVKSKITAAARLFSSGTTGLPKAVTNKHGNFVAQQEVIFEIHQRDYERRRIVAMPIFHAAVAPSTHVGALKSGHKVYMMRRFDLPLYLQTCMKYQITDLTLVPPLAIALLMNDMTHEKPYLRSVRSASCGAAPLDKGVKGRLGKLLGPGAPFAQVWGMTETTCIAMCFEHPESEDTGPVGGRLVDDQGKNISAYGTRGELCVRGPTVTPGYFNSPTANSESFDEDGWFHTGDIAYCDAESRKWYIVDRKKDLIKVRGFQVAPPELEAVLLSHPLIVHTAVIGIKSKRESGSELVRAYVVRRPGKGEGLTEGEYKALTGGVRFVEVIPRNASGKILKRVLREEAEGASKARGGARERTRRSCALLCSLWWGK
ncbi:putative AMP-binding enzyme [Aspergillus falconensis]